MPGLDRMPEGWGEAAAAYDRIWLPFMRQYAEDALRLAGVRADERVIDVAAGPGTLTLVAANLGARVVAIDFSPPMLDQLRQHVVTARVATVMAAVMDGQSLALPEVTFDAAYSMFGLIFFSDQAAGLRELRRVLRPDGRVVVSGWGRLERTRILAVLAGVVRRALPDLPSSPGPLPGAGWQDPVQLAHDLRVVGFRDVRVETVTHWWEAPSTDAVWESTQGTPACAALLRSLDADQQTAVRAALVDALRAEFGDGPVRLEQDAQLGSGIR